MLFSRLIFIASLSVVSGIATAKTDLRLFLSSDAESVPEANATALANGVSGSDNKASVSLGGAGAAWHWGGDTFRFGLFGVSFSGKQETPASLFGSTLYYWSDIKGYEVGPELEINITQVGPIATYVYANSFLAHYEAKMDSVLIGIGPSYQAVMSSMGYEAGGGIVWYTVQHFFGVMFDVHVGGNTFKMEKFTSSTGESAVGADGLNENSGFATSRVGLRLGFCITPN